ncbi:hypothetical protein [Lactococcus lactis]|uniref:Uncharacterized protein n=2 Tax=Lactococcus lactis TaxID=1358 RepID=A0AB35K945_9LACT|nr:hypothetical protein [Lactococcus lactis]MDG4978098.1 hypothetical protein [Lactococcus lactis]MDG5047597.1 hypothetical protein [Lactococcus lactis]
MKTLNFLSVTFFVEIISVSSLGRQILLTETNIFYKNWAMMTFSKNYYLQIILKNNII